VQSRRLRQFEENKAEIETYIQALRIRGLRLPEDPQRKAEIFFEQVEAEAGLNFGALTLRNVETEGAYNVLLRDKVKEAAATLGLEIRLLPASFAEADSGISYKQLLQKGTEQRQHQLKGKSHSKQQLYNTRWALNFYRKASVLGEDTSLGYEFTSDFTAEVERVTGKIGKVGTRKKFQTEIFWWRDFYRFLLNEQPLPKELLDAIVFLIDKSKMPLKVLAKLLGV
jgi:hypothetical protein